MTSNDFNHINTLCLVLLTDIMVLLDTNEGQQSGHAIKPIINNRCDSKLFNRPRTVSINGT